MLTAPTYTEFYVQTTGDNTNAGSTQSDAAVYSATNGGWNSVTGVFTPTSGNPSLSVAVGDFASVYNDGATLAVFVGRVTAVSSTTITVSTTIIAGVAPTTSGTARTIKVGGAWKGLDGAVIFPFNFATTTLLKNSAGRPPRINIKAGVTYLPTVTTTANQSGMAYEGYTTIPGDGGIAVFDYAGGVTFFNGTGLGCSYTGIKILNSSSGASAAFLTSVNCLIRRCVVKDCAAYGFRLGAGSVAVECEASGWNQGGSSSISGFNAFNANDAAFIRCYAHDPAGGSPYGFSFTTASQGVFTIIDCIAANIGGGSGFKIGGSSGMTLVVKNCCAYNCGSHGFEVTGSSRRSLYLENCNIFKCGGYGVLGLFVVGAETTVTLVNCASGTGSMANASGRHNDVWIVDIDPVTYPAGEYPWRDPRAGDFSLVHRLAKSTGRGLFLQAQLPNTLTTGYPDIGAAAYNKMPAMTNWDSPVQEVA